MKFMLWRNISQLSLFLVPIALALAISGCGSPSTDTDSQNAVSNTDRVQNANAVVQPPAPVDANTVNSTIVDGSVADANSNTGFPSSVADAKQDKFEKLREGKGDMTGMPANVKPAKREAPDNSEYWSTLTDVAVETRAFRDHPEILKAEKINDGRTVKIKVYLKNGNVVEAPGDRVRDFPRESVNTFASIAGVKLIKPPPVVPDGKPGKQKDVSVFPKVQ